MGQLVLLAPAVSADTVAALEELLVRARSGQVIGLAWVAMHSGYQYTVDIAGATKRSPTFTRGMLLALDDELSKIVAPNA